MISTLRKENVEPLSIIALAGQRNLKSLDSYSSTSMEQQKDMSAKLSNITAPDQVRTPVKSTESKILKPSIAAQQSEKPENSSKNLFTGAVFHNCHFSFAGDAGFNTGEHSTFQAKKFKRISPLSDSDFLRHFYVHRGPTDVGKSENQFQNTK